MMDAGKILMGLGAAAFLIGGLVWLLGRIGFRGLPGDIRYQSDNIQVFIPITTCLLLSVLLSLAVALWHWFTRR